VERCRVVRDVLDALQVITGAVSCAVRRTCPETTISW
jgi:hypothetical protein